MLAWVVLWDILLTLFPMEFRTWRIVVCRFQSHCLFDVVCKLLLLHLSMCWLGCTSSLWIVVPIWWPLLLLLQGLHPWSLLLNSSMCSSRCGSWLSIRPMYAWNLYFHSSKVPFSCWWLHFVSVHVDQSLCCCTFCLLCSIWSAWCFHCCWRLFSSSARTVVRVYAQCCWLWLNWIVEPGLFAPLPCKNQLSLVHVVLYVSSTLLYWAIVYFL